MRKIALCFVCGWVLLDCVASGATPDHSFSDVAGANLVPSRTGGMNLFLFSPVTRAEKVVGKSGNLTGGEDNRLVAPSELPSGLGKGLSGIGRIRLAKMLAGGRFRGYGLCRRLRVVRLHHRDKLKKKYVGVSWASIDRNRAIALDRPLPETLSPCDVICNLSDDETPAFLASVPEVWPQEISGRQGAPVPRFVRLSNRDWRTWHQEKNFLSYETIAKNPFVLDVGKPARVIDIVKMKEGKVLVLSSSGQCVEYDYSRNTWGELSRLVEEELIGVAPMSGSDSFVIFWRAPDGAVNSSVANELRQLGEAKSEKVSLTGMNAVRLASSDAFIWLLGVQEKEGGGSVVLASRREKKGVDWRPWTEVCRFPKTVDLLIDACSVLTKEGEFLFVAVTNRRARTVQVFVIPEKKGQTGEKSQR